MTQGGRKKANLLRLQNAENPAFHLNCVIFSGQQFGLEELIETAILVDLLQPGSRDKGVVLIRRSIFPGIIPAPQRRVDFDQGGFSSRDLPAIERPEVSLVTQLIAEIPQPRQPGMGRPVWQGFGVRWSSTARDSGDHRTTAKPELRILNPLSFDYL